jgi:hypothetical protein
VFCLLLYPSFFRVFLFPFLYLRLYFSTFKFIFLRLQSLCMSLRTSCFLLYRFSLIFHPFVPSLISLELIFTPLFFFLYTPFFRFFFCSTGNTIIATASLFSAFSVRHPTLRLYAFRCSSNPSSPTIARPVVSNYPHELQVESY